MSYIAIYISNRIGEKMAENDIYKSKKRYETLVSQIEKFSKKIKVDRIETANTINHLWHNLHWLG
jgi:hypothetical protein